MPEKMRWVNADEKTVFDFYEEKRILLFFRLSVLSSLLSLITFFIFYFRDVPHLYISSLITALGSLVAAILNRRNFVLAKFVFLLFSEITLLCFGLELGARSGILFFYLSMISCIFLFHSIGSRKTLYFHLLVIVISLVLIQFISPDSYLEFAFPENERALIFPFSLFISTGITTYAGIFWIRNMNRVKNDLHENILRQKAVFDTLQDVVWSLNIKDLSLNYINNAVQNILNISMDEFIHLSINDYEKFISLEQKTTVLKEMGKIYTNGWFDMEFKIFEQNPKWVNLKAKLIKNEDGYPLRIDGILRDITVRKTAERLLQENEARLNQVIDTSLDAVIEIDELGLITRWNKHAEQIFDYSKEEALGRKLEDLIIPPKYRQSHRHGLENYLKYNRHLILNRRVEITAIRKNGKEFPVELSVTPLHYNGRKSFSAFLRDISERKNQEKALVESEKQLREISATIPGAVFQFKVDFGNRYSIPFISEGIDQLSGLRPENIVSNIRGFFDCISSEYREKVEGAIKTSILEHATFLCDFKIKHTITNEEKWIRAHALPSLQDEGMIVWNGTLTDITNEKIAEDNLRRSEEQYRLLIETMNEGLIYANLENKIIFVNPQLCKMTGYSNEELIGKRILDVLLFPDDKRRFEKLLAEQGLKGIQSQYKLKIRKKDGSFYWSKISTNGYYNENKELIGIIGTHTDITQEVKGEEALKESEEYYKMMFENSPVPMIICDSETFQFQDVNKAVTVLYGYSHEEFLQITPLQLQNSEDFEMFRKEAEEKKGTDYIVTHYKKDKTPVIVHLYIKEIIIHQKSSFLVMILDITEKQKAEEKLKQLNEQIMQHKIEEQNMMALAVIQGQEEERKRFVAEIHDGIGQLLTAAKLNLNILQELIPDEAKSTLDTTTRLLNTAIYESRNIAYNLMPFSLSNMGLKAAIKDLCNNSVISSGNKVNCRISYTGTNVSSSLELHMFRIIQEGINNVLKHASANHAEIILREHYDYIELMIKDDGVGMNKSGNRGNGISNMQNRISLLNGQFNIKTSPGKGTQINIQIPVN